METKVQSQKTNIRGENVMNTTQEVIADRIGDKLRANNLDFVVLKSPTVTQAYSATAFVEPYNYQKADELEYGLLTVLREDKVDLISTTIKRQSGFKDMAVTIVFRVEGELK